MLSCNAYVKFERFMVVVPVGVRLTGLTHLNKCTTVTKA